MTLMDIIGLVIAGIGFAIILFCAVMLWRATK